MPAVCDPHAVSSASLVAQVAKLMVQSYQDHLRPLFDVLTRRCVYDGIPSNQVLFEHFLSTSDWEMLFVLGAATDFGTLLEQLGVRVLWTRVLRLSQPHCSRKTVREMLRFMRDWEEVEIKRMQKKLLRQQERLLDKVSGVELMLAEDAAYNLYTQCLLNPVVLTLTDGSEQVYRGTWGSVVTLFENGALVLQRE